MVSLICTRLSWSSNEYGVVTGVHKEAKLPSFVEVMDNMVVFCGNWRGRSSGCNALPKKIGGATQVGIGVFVGIAVAGMSVLVGVAAIGIVAVAVA